MLLPFVDGATLLLGSQRPEELEAAVRAGLRTATPWRGHSAHARPDAEDRRRCHDRAMAKRWNDLTPRTRWNVFVSVVMRVGIAAAASTRHRLDRVWVPMLAAAGVDQ